MDEQTAKALRKQFPPELVGKRPQLTCRDCSKSNTKNCGKHSKRNCDVCGQWISTSHTHLDFVGHADITDRFLSVDPDWNWEPVERRVDPEMLKAAIATGNPEIVRQVLDAAPPKFDSNGGMWMRVTIAGVTRYGYGDAAGKSGPNAIKEAIGDGLRNAGMRFGAGLDMWRKEPTGSEASQTVQPAAEQTTNHDWLTGMERRIATAASEQELETLANEIEAKVQSGFCEQAHYEHLWALGEQRLRDVQEHTPQPSPPAPPTPEPVAAPTNGTDPVAAFKARLQNAETLEALAELKTEVMAAFKGQQFGPTDGNELLRGIKHRQHEVGTRVA